jgi:adenine-specific DNA-methyltransferase
MASKQLNEEIQKLQDEIERLKKNLKKKKFGLVWEDKPEQVAIDCKTKFPILTEIKSNAILASNDAQSPTNILIEGDNYHALSILNYTHKGKIDLIYIDPPYNTGNKDFKYNDNFVDKEDSFRHSKWLSFMEKRLKLARELLSDKGVIFISIDDNEQANLKLLCDDVFGSYADIMIWRKSGVGRDGKMKNTTTFRKDHEYIIVSFKNKQELNKSFEKPNWENEYGNPDNDPRGNYKSGSISRKESASNEHSLNYYTVTSPSGQKFTRQFEIPQTEFDQLNNDNRIYWGKNGNAVPSQKIFVDEKREVSTSSLFDYKTMTTTFGSKELEALFGIKDIGLEMRPKPSVLIIKLLQIGSQKNSLILDFFAGSGTTADAVMKLNKEDGGNRQFILCTNNENNICRDITYQRIKTVITGKRKDKSKYSDGIPANLRYFKTDFIERAKDTDENRVQLTKYCYEFLRIRESCYQEIKTKQQNIKFWNNHNKLLCVIFDKYDEIDDKIYLQEIKNKAKGIEQIVIYRFSIDGNLDMNIKSLKNAKLEEIPEEMLKVFQQIFKD